MGYIMGYMLAFVLSYCHWHSIAWAIVTGFVSWFYVIYWLIFLGDW